MLLLVCDIFEKLVEVSSSLHHPPSKIFPAPSSLSASQDGQYMEHSPSQLFIRVIKLQEYSTHLTKSITPISTKENQMSLDICRY